MLAHCPPTRAYHTLQAKEAYEVACKLEPSDHALQTMRHKAEVNEAKQEGERVVMFKQSRQSAKSLGAAQDGPAAVRNNHLLSFDSDGQD